MRRRKRARRGTILDVYEHREELVSPAQLEQFVSRMPSGCHLLSAPSEPEDMERLKIEHYDAVVEALKRFYSLIFVTMAPGVMDDICKWAFGAADQIVFVTDSRLVTADQTLRALPLLRSRHPEVPLQLVINQVPRSPTPPQQQVIDAQLANGVADTTLRVPWDARLEAQLDSGTLDPRRPRPGDHDPPGAQGGDACRRAPPRVRTMRLRDRPRVLAAAAATAVIVALIGVGIGYAAHGASASPSDSPRSVPNTQGQLVSAHRAAAGWRTKAVNAGQSAASARRRLQTTDRKLSRADRSAHSARRQARCWRREAQYRSRHPHHHAKC